MQAISSRYSTPVFLAVFVSGLALILLAEQPLHFIPDAVHDDYHFVQQAISLAEGSWLGRYNENTLVKGPFYPLVLAVGFHLGLPLRLTHFGLYLLASSMFAVAIRPLFIGRGAAGWWTLGLFCLLLFSPAFSDGVPARILRVGAYTPLTLLVLAGAIGVLLREGATRRQMPWALLTGLTIGPFWLTREEGVWLLPSLLLIAVYLVLRWWRRGALTRGSALRHVALLAIPVVGLLMAVTVATGLNYGKYGVWTLNEMKSGAFPQAHGALARIDPDHKLPGILVRRHALEQAYLASPTLSTLRPYLSGRIARNWSVHGQGWLQREHSAAWENELPGGWFPWAFRSAAAAAGHFGSAPEAANFFERVATELNSACDRGELSCGPPQSGVVPPLREYDMTAVVARMASGFWNLLNRRFSTAVPPSKPGGITRIVQIAELTRTAPAPFLATDGPVMITGWTFTPGDAEALHLVPTSSAGEALQVDGELTWQASPDVAEYFTRIDGVARPEAASARFVLRLDHGVERLGIFGNDGALLGVLPVEINATATPVGEVSVRGRVERITAVNGVPTLRSEDWKENGKRKALDLVGSVYSKLLPIAFFGSLPVVAWLMIDRQWGPSRFSVLLITAALSMAIGARFFILAAIDLKMFQAIGVRGYEAPIYPLILAFVFIVYAYFFQHLPARFRSFFDGEQAQEAGATESA